MYEPLLWWASFVYRRSLWLVLVLRDYESREAVGTYRTGREKHTVRTLFAIRPAAAAAEVYPNSSSRRALQNSFRALHKAHWQAPVTAGY